MGNGVIGKILYFWIFIIGGLFIAKVMGLTKDDKTMVIFCLALAGVYVVYQLARYFGKKKREAKEEENRQPVRKGASHKRR
ncbi:MAG: hypothetical protein GX663_06270 [Clostridiales bacterium]|nr:hypothetical protein [Clostridiales bacterium]